MTLVAFYAGLFIGGLLGIITMGVLAMAKPKE